MMIRFGITDFVCLIIKAMRVLTTFDKKVITAIVEVNEETYTFDIPKIMGKIFDSDCIFQIRENHDQIYKETGGRNFRLLVTADNKKTVNKVYIALANLKSCLDYLLRENLIYTVSIPGFTEIDINGFVNSNEQERSKNIWSMHDPLRYELFCMLSNSYRFTENLRDLKNHNFETIEERNRQADLKIQRITIGLSILATIISLLALIFR